VDNDNEIVFLLSKQLELLSRQVGDEFPFFLCVKEKEDKTSKEKLVLTSFARWNFMVLFRFSRFCLVVFYCEINGGRCVG
jgi:hypothetical protein